MHEIDINKATQPYEYYLKFIKQNCRPDNRRLSDIRPCSISPGCINTVNGSAMVKLGSTVVLCGKKKINTKFNLFGFFFIWSCWSYHAQSSISKGRSLIFAVSILLFCVWGKKKVLKIEHGYQIIGHISGNESKTGSSEVSIDICLPKEQHVKLSHIFIRFYGFGWPSKR